MPKPRPKALTPTQLKLLSKLVFEPMKSKVEALPCTPEEGVHDDGTLTKQARKDLQLYYRARHILRQLEKINEHYLALRNKYE